MTVREDTSLKRFATLLDEATNLRPTATPTFLEIAGLSHRELVLQRYLEFFLSPNTDHGLDGLLANSLVQVAEQDPAAEARVEEVLTEVSTDSGLRLDIVLLEEHRTVKVELKIDAALYNDLQAYAQFSKPEWPTDAEELRIVLAPGRGRDWQLPHGFRIVTFGAFTARLRANLGSYITSSLDTRYLTYLLDLILTMERLEEGTTLDDQFINLLARDDLDVQEFLRRVNSTNRDLKYQCEALKVALDADDTFGAFDWTVYGNSKGWLGASVYANARIGDVDARVVVWIAPKGWGISIEAPRGGNSAPVQAELERRSAHLFEPVLDGNPPHFRRMLDVPSTESDLIRVTTVLGGLARELSITARS